MSYEDGKYHFCRHIRWLRGCLHQTQTVTPLHPAQWALIPISITATTARNTPEILAPISQVGEVKSGNGC